MKPLGEDSLTILRDLAAESDPAPATEADAREARAAYERATSEAAAMAQRPFSDWSEGDLEGRHAELTAEIADGAFTGDVLAHAIRERDAIWREIISIRLGGLDDENDGPMDRDDYEDYLEHEERSYMGLDEF